MELLDKYIKTKREIFQYFGSEDYTRDISDSREYYWCILGENSCVGFSEEEPGNDEDFEWTYQSEIY